MYEIWSAEIGRWTYYILYSVRTTRWQLCRRHEDPRDDDMVAQGVSRHRRPTQAQIIDEVIDELEAIQEGMKS